MNASPIPEPALFRGRLAPLVRLAYWITPSLLCLILYWYGLRSGYRRDDFAWLALHLRIHDLPSLLSALFQPFAQGTIRPLSERLFFLAGWLLSGTDATPLRVAVFLTQFANLVLLTAITRKLTGSALAGFVAPLLWITNANIYMPMSWTSAYNQVLCAFFMLLAFYLFVRFTETRDWRFYAGQWISFLLGLGALEIMVVYPALAALFAVCCARRYLVPVLPMFAVSAAYTAVHRLVAPPLRSDTYRMFFDSGIFGTLWDYLTRSFGAHRYATYRDLPVWPHYVAEQVLLIALLGFGGWMLYRRRWLAAFFIGWFFIVLAPVLPLRNHVSDYYLTIPVIGFAMLGAWAVSMARQRGLAVSLLAAVLVLAYALPSAWASRAMTNRSFAITRRVQTFISSVAYAHKLHPDKVLLIRNLDDDLFWFAFWDNPFQLFGLTEIYVAPECENNIRHLEEYESIARHFLPQALALEGFAKGSIVAYEVLDDGRLANDTVLYYPALARRTDLLPPKYLDVGKPWSSVQLGEGWWPLEKGNRWTKQRAELRLGGPSSAGGSLRVRGMCPVQHLAAGPLLLTATIAGRKYPPSPIDRNNLQFDFRYPLADDTVGKQAIDIVIEFDRTLKVPWDRRELGVVFGTFEVVP